MTALPDSDAMIDADNSFLFISFPNIIVNTSPFAIDKEGFDFPINLETVFVGFLCHQPESLVSTL